MSSEPRTIDAPRMPAEWEFHHATWLAWPHKTSDWPGKFAPIPWVYGEIVRRLTQRERVEILVRDEFVLFSAQKILRAVEIDENRVGFHLCPNDRSWVRDSGPTFVQRGTERALIDWRFNAWAKYDDHLYDDRIPAEIAELRGLPLMQPEVEGKRVVLEGGSIDVNGAGLLLTTEECLLSKIQERNPGLDRAGYEKVFRDTLGIEKVLWLDKGIVGDDTHGHVDDLARFVKPNTIVVVQESDESDENYAILRENRERLEGFTNLTGGRLEIVDLPMPAPLIHRGIRLPASYANFYIANDLVLVPTFNDAQDRVALGILAEQFPDREVVGIHAVDLVWGLGTLHCMTQQEPA